MLNKLSLSVPRNYTEKGMENMAIENMAIENMAIENMVERVKFINSNLNFKQSMHTFSFIF